MLAGISDTSDAVGEQHRDTHPVIRLADLYATRGRGWTPWHGSGRVMFDMGADTGEVDIDNGSSWAISVR